MKECVNCKAILEDDELFCHGCGTKQGIEKAEAQAEETQELQGKKCIHCGETIDDDSLFCPYCGKQQNEPSSEATKKEDKTSEKNNKDKNLEEEPKEENNPVQELSDNKQVKEPNIEEDYSQFKKWIYIVLAIILLSVFGLYLYRNHTSHVEETDNSDIENVIKMAEANKPKSEKPKLQKLDYKTFLDMFKQLSPDPTWYTFQEPPQNLIDKYGLERYEYITTDYKVYILGNNIRLDGTKELPTGEHAWCFVLSSVQDEDQLLLKIFNQNEYDNFVDQAVKYGLISCDMVYERDGYISPDRGMMYSAFKPIRGETVHPNSEEEMQRYDIIGPFGVIASDNIILLSRNYCHWTFKNATE